MSQSLTIPLSILKVSVFKGHKMRNHLLTIITVAVVNGKVVQTVAMDDKVISKQSDSEWDYLLLDPLITNSRV